MQEKERIIIDDKNFLSFCPFVSRFPFEICIIPKKHESYFCKMSSEEIKSLAFRVNFINGFPLEVDAKMDFVDENFKRTTTLFDKVWETVKSGKQTGSDCQIEPYFNPPLNIDFPVEKIDSIAEAKNIIIYARISTPGFDENPPRIITFCNDHTFEAYIGVIVDAEVNSADYQ